MIEIVTLSIITLAIATLGMLFIIDLKKWILPNKYVFALAVLGIIFHFLTDFTIMKESDLILGALTGGGFLFTIRMVANGIYKQESLGLGDVKLMAAGGLWLGMHGILLAITVGAIFGLIHGIAIYAHKRFFKKEKISFNRMSLPAGPGFIIGLLISAFIYLGSGINNVIGFIDF